MNAQRVTLFKLFDLGSPCQEIPALFQGEFDSGKIPVPLT